MESIADETKRERPAGTSPTFLEAYPTYYSDGRYQPVDFLSRGLPATVDLLKNEEETVARCCRDGQTAMKSTNRYAWVSIGK